MEQKTMFYITSARNHSSKVCNFKKALQVALLVAVVIWLSYQVKNSHDKPKNYGGKPQNKISKELESETSTLLGRRGKEKFIVNGSMMYFEENGRREDGGVGDDEFARNIEERDIERELEKQHIDERIEDERVEEKILVHTRERQGTSEAISQGDVGHEIHSFRDQTGVPIDLVASLSA